MSAYNKKSKKNAIDFANFKNSPKEVSAVFYKLIYDCKAHQNRVPISDEFTKYLSDELKIPQYKIEQIIKNGLSSQYIHKYDTDFIGFPELEDERLRRAKARERAKQRRLKKAQDSQMSSTANEEQNLDEYDYNFPSNYKDILVLLEEDKLKLENQFFKLTIEYQKLKVEYDLLQNLFFQLIEGKTKC